MIETIKSFHFSTIKWIQRSLLIDIQMSNFPKQSIRFTSVFRYEHADNLHVASGNSQFHTQHACESFNNVHQQQNIATFVPDSCSRCPNPENIALVSSFLVFTPVEQTLEN